MSFILDALKKSELERQRQAIPGLMDTKVAHARTRLPLWAIAVMALLGINLTVLMVVLTRGGAPTRSSAATGASAAAPPRAAPPRAAPQPAAPPRADAATAPGAPDHFSPLDTPDAAAPLYAPEIPIAAAARAEAGAGALTHTPAAAIPAQGGGAGSSGHASHRRDPLLLSRDDKPDDEVLPTISEVNTAGSEPLPDLHLDVHVYATNPAERFVYVNMRKYHEGSTLEEGPTIERIRRDGVVLNFHGLRFVLPRQQ